MWKTSATTLLCFTCKNRPVDVMEVKNYRQYLKISIKTFRKGENNDGKSMHRRNQQERKEAGSRAHGLQLNILSC